jgi:hypothetical protein
MKEIILTQGKVALVDDEDFDRLNQFKWFVLIRGIRCRAARQVETEKGKRNLYMHHAVIGKPAKGYDVDHKDHNSLNNTRENLRFVTRRQNMQNLVKEGMTSKYPGVYWVKARRKWSAGYWIKNKRYHVGTYTKEEDAFSAYREAINSIGEKMLEGLR